jgi:Fic family protein
MRCPQRAPSPENEVFTDPTLLARLVSDPGVKELVRKVQNDYLHWDKFRHLPLPAGFTHQQIWTYVRIGRESAFRELPLSFTRLGCLLEYSTPPRLNELLHRIDFAGGGTLGTPSDEPIQKTERDRYLISALMEEAIASSQMEGATTTREVAKKMLRSERRPRDRSERMIVNNYQAIRSIKELLDQPLTPSLICRIQEIITHDTLDCELCSGRFRDDQDEDVCVADTVTGDVLHRPPAPSEIDARIDELCKFANSPPEEFVHPVLIAIAIHFAIGFIHPFVDGNGRTARALFYWYMLRSNYWLFEWLPISRAVLKSLTSYGKAYLNTETDGGDLTYFFLYNLKAIDTAITQTHRYLERQGTVIAEARRLFSRIPGLNLRQLQVANEAVRDSTAWFDVRSYVGTYNVARNTARSDLRKLVEAGILEAIAVGNKERFIPAEHLKQQVLNGRIVPKQAAARKAGEDLSDDDSEERSSRDSSD